ncbi:hypothetical protein Q4485_08285 [Granulosicoccaceae sp. 1_MG-2023]|nr:hypothetical protein [Granulosicoccaceae sp. 1_MG-2023]
MELMAVGNRMRARLARFSRRNPGPVQTPQGKGYIGVDFGSAQMRAVQLDWQDGRAGLLAACVCDYPCARETLFANKPALRRFVQDALRGGGFVGRDIVTCTPKSHLRVFPIDYPISDELSEEQVIMNVLQQRIDDDPGDLVIDYLQTRTGNNNAIRKAIVAVARLPEQMQYLDVLRQAGLNVCALEINPVALRRLLASRQGFPAEHNVLTINVGAEASYMTVTSGQRLVLDRQYSFGENRVIAQLCEALEMTAEESAGLLLSYGVDTASTAPEPVYGVISPSQISDAVVEIVTPVCDELSREVEKVSAYVHSQLHGAAIDEILLLGRMSRWPGAADFLSGLLGKPVSLFNPFSVLQHSQASAFSDTQAAACMAMACGSALRQPV